ncbi:MAG: MgtC/SapB family protein [Hyphomonadaceae bacterium]
MEFLELAQRLGLALAIGFLVGVERGWKSREAEAETRVAGLRTYTLIGLFGGVSAALGVLFHPIAFGALATVFGLSWLVYKAWETWKDGDISITGLVAGLLVFALGAFAIVGDMQIAAGAGVIVVATLAFKDALHNWLETLTWPEIRSALLILAATLIALPLLPNRTLDPWGLFNPREIWLLTIVIAAASFAGYVALRALGQKTGLYVGAAAGALVSSTAVTLDLARRAKAGEAPAMQAASAATLANLVMVIRVGALIGVFAQPALLSALPALIAAGIILVGAAALGFARAHSEAEAPQKLSNPLDVKSVVAFAALLAIVTALTKIISAQFGDAGLFAFAATAGLMDVDAVALAVGGLARAGMTNGGLDPHSAAEAILLAAAANTVAKIAIAGSVGGRAFAGFYAAFGAAALIVGALAFLFVDLGALGGI